MDLLTPEQVRQILGISEATYFRWLREKRLRGQRAGRNWRFERAAIDQLLLEGTSVGDVRKDVGVAIEIYESLLLGRGLKKSEVQAMAKPNDGRALVRMLLEHAVAGEAATIHVDSIGGNVAVRERIDGALSRIERPLPKASGGEIVRVVKELAGIPDTGPAITEGRFTTEISGRTFYVWASTYPTTAGESVTLQLLDAKGAVVPLDDFGFSEEQRVLLRRMLAEPSGAIIVTGPHGCGKTSTAYTLLEELRQDASLKIMTAEDPVSFHIDGIQQAEVGGPNGIGFYRALQGMLDSDLDVGMIAEFRDPETIDLFFKAAHTGHLMIGVMHAPDPAAVLRTLLEVGKVLPPMVASNLRGIITQRLYRKSCPHCREQRPITTEDADALGLAGADRKLKVSTNKGCAKCRQTGFRGRVMVAHVFAPGRLDGAQAFEDARHGLRESLLEKVRKGEVAPKEACVYKNL